MRKIAVVGSRYMSSYGKEVIGKLMDKLKSEEVVTIKVAGCNSEIIKRGAKKVFFGENFGKLNEDVANYADILIIIEGGKNSGTLLLANNFVEKNKDVYCVPGKISDEGSFVPNWLIKEGAIPLISIDDLTLLR